MYIMLKKHLRWVNGQSKVCFSPIRYLKFTDDMSVIDIMWEESKLVIQLYKQRQVRSFAYPFSPVIVSLQKW